MNIRRLLVPLMVNVVVTSFAFPAETHDRAVKVEAGLLSATVAAGAPKKRPLLERMRHHHVPGVSIVVIDGGELAWARGYGVAEAGNASVVTAETLFQAASISKPVAAMVALHLVEQGKLTLDADVNAQLRSWKVPENEFTAQEKVTLHRLLSHTAGLTVHGFRGYAASEPVPTLMQILNGEKPANSPPIRVDIVPGTKNRYSGGGYVVLHQLLVDVMAMPFPELAQKTVLGPLEMKHSTFAQPLPERLVPSATTGHRSDGQAIIGKSHTYPELAPDGLWTTPSDLARFAIALQRALSGKSNLVLSATMTKQMLTPQMGDYGLGIAVHGEGRSLRFEHGGGNEGFRCFLVGYAETGQGAVVMTNGDEGVGLTMEVLRSIAVEYDWPDFRPKEVATVRVDAATLADYAGKYRFEGMGVVTVSVEAGALITAVNGKRMEMLATSDTTFVGTDGGPPCTFSRDTTGKVSLTAARRTVEKLPAVAPPAERSPEGYWEGAVALPGTALGVAVTLERADGSIWSGTIDIPQQGMRGVALAEVTVAGNEVSFKIPGIPGDPTFQCQSSEDAMTLRGSVRQGGQTQTFPVSLERTAPPEKKVEQAEATLAGVPGTGASGTWQGVLRVGPAALRLQLNVARSANGTLTATLDSIDQGAKDIPISAIAETEEAVTFEVNVIGGTFAGKFNADGSDIAGTWTQGGQSLPLVFKRMAK